MVDNTIRAFISCVHAVCVCDAPLKRQRPKSVCEWNGTRDANVKPTKIFAILIHLTNS